MGIDSPIHTIQVRHEQKTAFMADGYARTARKPGVLRPIARCGSWTRRGWRVCSAVKRRAGP